MAENGWAARRMRAFKRTTIPSDPDKVFKDLIGRDFTAAIPGTRMVGDITYLRTGEWWLYLATVIDLCTRMIVGWAMADHMRASLCVNALTMARDPIYKLAQFFIAIVARNIHPENSVFGALATASANPWEKPANAGTTPWQSQRSRH